jgi:hypothetical protein
MCPRLYGKNLLDGNIPGEEGIQTMDQLTRQGSGPVEMGIHHPRMYPGIGSPGAHDFHCAAQEFAQTILQDLLNRKIRGLSLPAVVVLSKKRALKKIAHGFLWDESQRYKVGECVLNVFACGGVAGISRNLILGAGVPPLSNDFFRITFRINTPAKIRKTSHTALIKHSKVSVICN